MNGEVILRTILWDLYRNCFFSVFKHNGRYYQTADSLNLLTTILHKDTTLSLTFTWVCGFGVRSGKETSFARLLYGASLWTRRQGVFFFIRSHQTAPRHRQMSNLMEFRPHRFRRGHPGAAGCEASPVTKAMLYCLLGKLMEEAWYDATTVAMHDTEHGESDEI